MKYKYEFEAPDGFEAGCCYNCFKTKEEATTKGKEIMGQIQKEYEEA